MLLDGEGEKKGKGRKGGRQKCPPYIAVLLAWAAFWLIFGAAWLWLSFAGMFLLLRHFGRRVVRIPFRLGCCFGLAVPTCWCAFGAWWVGAQSLVGVCRDRHGEIREDDKKERREGTIKKGLLIYHLSSTMDLFGWGAAPWL